MKRDHNEDSFFADDALSLYVVADGMGGHQGGDHASRLAVEIVRDRVAGVTDFEAAAKEIIKQGRGSGVMPAMPPAGGGGGFTAEATSPAAGDGPTDPGVALPPPATVLLDAAKDAGRQIYDAAQNDPRLNGMGTTLTAALFTEEKVFVAHVGDSRAFLFRDGKIQQLTEDHSWVAEQVKAGLMSNDEARESAFRHIITRSVGFEREVDLDLVGVPVLPGDCFLMCSDGLTNYVETEELGRLLGVTYYRRAPRLLVDLANERGGDDNISVVVVYVANEK